MNRQHIQNQIQKAIQEGCLVDISEETEISQGTIIRWRDDPPEKPSLNVFCRLARFAGFNPPISLLEDLF